MTRVSFKNRSLALMAVLGLMVSQTACLKTRAQLREEGGDEDRGGAQQSGPTGVKAATPQDVQPQGQYAIDEMKGEFTRLEGRVEDVERTQKQSATNPAGPSKEELKKLETRIVELEQAQANMLDAIKKMQETPSVAADPSELIEKGRNQIEAGNFDGAIETLSAALKTAKGKKAEDATFLRAEAYFAAKDYKKAIVDYSKFPEKYTRSSYMPKALYKIGQSFEQLGMKDDARGFYQELVEKHPKSPEAKKARSKIK
jgi:TolA-binding protein